MNYTDYDEIFIQASQLPMALSNEEIYLLIENMHKNNDNNAFDTIIIHNVRLVIYEVSKRFKNVNYDRKELVSIGIEGLIKATRSFDITKGLQFSTYAIKCIHNEIASFLRKLNNNTRNIINLDDIVVDDEDRDLRLFNILRDDTDIEEECVKKDTYELIRTTVNNLSYRDKEIIMMYFGFYNDRQYSQDEIAAKFNVSQSYICRIVGKLVKHLGLTFKAQGLIETTKFLKTKKKQINM